MKTQTALNCFGIILVNRLDNGHRSLRHRAADNPKKESKP